MKYICIFIMGFLVGKFDQAYGYEYGYEGGLATKHFFQWAFS